MVVSIWSLKYLIAETVHRGSTVWAVALFWIVVYNNELALVAMVFHAAHGFSHFLFREVSFLSLAGCQLVSSTSFMWLTEWA